MADSGMEVKGLQEGLLGTGLVRPGLRRQESKNGETSGK